MSASLDQVTRFIVFCAFVAGTCFGWFYLVCTDGIMDEEQLITYTVVTLIVGALLIVLVPRRR